MELNRCAYTILGILRTKKATDKVHGITISEISQFEKTSKYSTIHKRIKEMQNLGYIDEGVKVCKAKAISLQNLVLRYYLLKGGNSQCIKRIFITVWILSLGQAGGNLTKRFEEEGFPCVVANSSIEDLATRNAKNKLHFRNGTGCHKNRKMSKALLRIIWNCLLMK